MHISFSCARNSDWKPALSLWVIVLGDLQGCHFFFFFLLNPFWLYLCCYVFEVYTYISKILCGQPLPPPHSLLTEECPRLPRVYIHQGIGKGWLTNCINLQMWPCFQIMNNFAISMIKIQSRWCNSEDVLKVLEHHVQI